MTTVFLSYYCSNLMSNNSVRKLMSNAVSSQKKLCPDVMVQKTQHHVHNDFKFRLGCKVQLIVWHFFYLAVVSMEHLVFPPSVTTYSMEVLWCGIKTIWCKEQTINLQVSAALQTDLNVYTANNEVRPHRHNVPDGKQQFRNTSNSYTFPHKKVEKP